jgi:small-conductance mechanosensitive channel
VRLLPADPVVRELAVSGAILAGSYLAARLLSALLGRVLGRAAARTRTTFDDRLVVALKRPVTYLIFLVGVSAAVARSPLPPAWEARLGQVLFALAVLLVSLTLLRAYEIFLDWYATESAAARESVLAREFSPLLGKVGRLAIVLVALITVLQRFHVDVNSLVVSLGVGSLALGLAAQDTLSNLFAGFALMLDRPFRIGDRIRLSTGELGDVTSIGMRATRMKTTDESLLVIPNSVLVKERVFNLSQPTRALTTKAQVAVARGSDLDVVKRLLAEGAAASPRVDDARAPSVLVTRLGEYFVELEVTFWVRDFVEQGQALSDVYEQAYRRLAGAGIEIPLPVRRVLVEPAGKEKETA